MTGLHSQIISATTGNTTSTRLCRGGGSRACATPSSHGTLRSSQKRKAARFDKCAFCVCGIPKTSSRETPPSSPLLTLRLQTSLSAKTVALDQFSSTILHGPLSSQAFGRRRRGLDSPHSPSTSSIAAPHDPANAGSGLAVAGAAAAAAASAALSFCFSSLISACWASILASFFLPSASARS